MSSPTKMHAAELDIDEGPVARLVAEQFPRWAGIPVTRVVSTGTDNAMARLGDDLVVRLPRLPGGARQIEREHRRLPRLAPHLPLTVPTPLAKGEPGDGHRSRAGATEPPAATPVTRSHPRPSTNGFSSPAHPGHGDDLLKHPHLGEPPTSP